MRTLVVDSLPEPGGQISTLYPEKDVFDVPGFPRVSGAELVRCLTDQAMRFGPDVRLEEPAHTMQRCGEHDFLLQTTRATYRTRTVLICAGAGAFTPNRLPARGAEQFEGRGLFYGVRDRQAFAGKRVLVVGGGNSAVDWALSLREISRAVTLVHRRDQFRAHEQSVAELRSSDVQLRVGCEVQELHGEGRVTMATIVDHATRELERVPTDAVLSFLGFKADLGALRAWGLAQDGQRGLAVGPDGATSVPGVYAAGAITGGPLRLDLLSVHFGQAAVAVNSAKAAIDPTAELSPGHSSSMKL
jgi:thioredoxin reductase (NADPH)